MKNTLKSLWYGQLCPADEPSSDYYHRKRLRDLDQAITRELESLRQDLPQKSLDTLERCIETIYERQELSETDAFINGFSLGVKIITEAEAEY